MPNIDRLADVSGNWYLVTTRPKKRKSFSIHLNNALEKKQLQQIILEIVELQESVYEDMILIRLSNYSEGKSHLQQVEHFQSIQRLKPNEASRMLNR